MLAHHGDQICCAHLQQQKLARHLSQRPPRAPVVGLSTKGSALTGTQIRWLMLRYRVADTSPQLARKCGQSRRAKSKASAAWCRCGIPEWCSKRLVDLLWTLTTLAEAEVIEAIRDHEFIPLAWSCTFDISRIPIDQDEDILATIGHGHRCWGI